MKSGDVDNGDDRCATAPACVNITSASVVTSVAVKLRPSVTLHLTAPRSNDDDRFTPGRLSQRVRRPYGTCDAFVPATFDADRRRDRANDRETEGERKRESSVLPSRTGDEFGIRQSRLDARASSEASY